MKINLKARFKNPAFIISFCTVIVAFVYTMLSLFDIVPNVSESAVLRLLTLIVEALAGAGILIDPTTKGVNDSDRAMTYYTEDDVRVIEPTDEDCEIEG